ncbi:phosphate ABC transporter permease [Gloeocapsopsis dulcis]|uniref:Phosphate ABC transporter permease n=1 Tax=Gloeocapsopsis dulcis AAB1 = 1H9 TaxID=1433147 RepID=A0A6N8FVB4_9CHRO|nr:phosphate ABC transporter permease [Gloeocapsopsis dulcis]MUL36799.1 phosphate ABC transporter permease [Gloeocapsopsis dulcis AAB1 = 1H9]WNN88595.1 phosphate ABC transporter permease [Gloeocapsopsis dulcis]
MLVPLTRQKFEQLIPRIATSDQYKYYWGKFPDFLKRLLISVVSVVVIWILRLVLGEGSSLLLFPLGAIAGLYWLWGPVLWASLRNVEYRKYPYSGFLRGRVLDVYITEELIGTEETVNNKGDLVIVENRERRLNIEVGDETEFFTEIQVPLRRTHQDIVPNQIAEMVVLSTQPDLSSIAKVTDIYIPSRNIWVSDYPYLQKNVFTEVSRRLRESREPRSRQAPRRRPRASYPQDVEEW